MTNLFVVVSLSGAIAYFFQDSEPLRTCFMGQRAPSFEAVLLLHVVGTMFFLSCFTVAARA